MKTIPFDIIAVDLDGTLLTSFDTLSPATCEALQTLAKQGKQLVVASARMPAAIVRVLGKWHPVTPCIALNGAVVYHTPGGQILPMVATTLLLPYARRIARSAMAMGCTICAYFPDGRWNASALNGAVQWEINACGIQPERIADSDDIIEEAPAKLLLYTDTPIQALQTAESLREQYGNMAECMVSDPICIEVTAKNVSKGTALRQVIAERPLSNPRVLAIGDGLNDLDMFRVATYSVAMGNAPDAVKEHADMVTETCDRDGVAVAMKVLGVRF